MMMETKRHNLGFSQLHALANWMTEHKAAIEDKGMTQAAVAEWASDAIGIDPPCNTNHIKTANAEAGIVWPNQQPKEKVKAAHTLVTQILKDQQLLAEWVGQILHWDSRPNSIEGSNVMTGIRDRCEAAAEAL